MTDGSHHYRSSRPKNVILWNLQILTTAAFFIAGYALFGYPTMVETFGTIGIRQRARYGAECIEVALAILFLTPRLSPVRAAWLVSKISGAVVSHRLPVSRPMSARFFPF
jgi:hypothetical protein